MQDQDKPMILLAVDVCRDVPLEKPARQLLRDTLSAEEFIWVLADAGHFNDATHVLARLLPQRECVWWACQCARQVPLSEVTPENELALTAAEKWVAEMTEESRLAAAAAAEEADIGTAAGCAAMAAFVTSGSFTPPGVPPVPMPPGLTARYVVASILGSALSPDPEQSPEKYRTFLRQGLELYRVACRQM